MKEFKLWVGNLVWFFCSVLVNGEKKMDEFTLPLSVQMRVEAGDRFDGGCVALQQFFSDLLVGVCPSADIGCFLIRELETIRDC